jgi:hypothetical protein
VTTDDLETALPDLDGMRIDLLRDNLDVLAPFQRDLLSQVEHPRINLGTGPPGRVD